MNPWIGGLLAAIAVGFGYSRYGWQGLLFAITVVVFWLLLQFSRTLRVMQKAAQAPKGRIDNAVRLHSKLKPGMRLLDILPVAGSLGERAGGEGAEEHWAWTDEGESRVVVRLRHGRVVDWQLQRPAGAGDTPPAAP
jgi:hypothetical protein